MKILFQDLCTDKINWNESLEGEALAKWNSFINDLNTLKNIRVPRCYARDHWPESIKTSALSDNEEVIKNPVSVTHSLVTTGSEDQSLNLSQIIDIERYSTLTQLLRVTAYILRFIRNAKKSGSDRETLKLLGQSSGGNLMLKN